MTYDGGGDYCPLLVDGWQYNAAFVVQFQPETDIEAGRFEGKVEHVKSHQATRFHSLDELLNFIAGVLAEIRNTEKP
jgi:hypothetical protein